MKGDDGTGLTHQETSFVTNMQLYLAIGVPIVVNTILTMTIFALLSSRISDLSTRMTEGFAAINQRFDDMRDLWRAELRRVEEVLDARLRHIEDREHP
jgi:hypothetical protein